MLRMPAKPTSATARETVLIAAGAGIGEVHGVDHAQQLVRQRHVLQDLGRQAGQALGFRARHALDAHDRLRPAPGSRACAACAAAGTPACRGLPPAAASRRVLRLQPGRAARRGTSARRRSAARRRARRRARRWRAACRRPRPLAGSRSPRAAPARSRGRGRARAAAACRPAARPAACRRRRRPSPAPAPRRAPLRATCSPACRRSGRRRRRRHGRRCRSPSRAPGRRGRAGCSTASGRGARCRARAPWPARPARRASASTASRGGIAALAAPGLAPASAPSTYSNTR